MLPKDKDGVGVSTIVGIIGFVIRLISTNVGVIEFVIRDQPDMFFYYLPDPDSLALIFAGSGFLGMSNDATLI